MNVCNATNRGERGSMCYLYEDNNNQDKEKQEVDHSSLCKRVNTHSQLLYKILRQCNDDQSKIKWEDLSDFFEPNEAYNVLNMFDSS
jgi:hypothetical protein